MGLTRCYKTTLFYIYITKVLLVGSPCIGYVISVIDREQGYKDKTVHCTGSRPTRTKRGTPERVYKRDYLLGLCQFASTWFHCMYYTASIKHR